MSPEKLRDWVLLDEAGVLEADEREELMGWKAREPEAYAGAQADVRALQAEILRGLIKLMRFLPRIKSTP